jgi:outer membrane protein OmpA-like peptidoglycan-associated protein
VKGRILDAKTKEPLSAKIEIVNNKTQTIDANFTSDQTTGEFIISLVSGINYGLSIEKNGYLFYSLNFDLVDSTNFNEIVLEVGLPDTCVNSSTVMRNIFFDYGKTILKAESKHEIEKVYNLLKKYPTMKLEISGHTDNVSSLRFNQKLSINRAKAVAKFLIDMGIEKNRLLTTGYAFSRPIADNSTIEGQRQNRRVELKILGY